jgi:hypothetical protein
VFNQEGGGGGRRGASAAVQAVLPAHAPLPSNPNDYVPKVFKVGARRPLSTGIMRKWLTLLAPRRTKARRRRAVTAMRLPTWSCARSCGPHRTARPSSPSRCVRHRSPPSATPHRHAHTHIERERHMHTDLQTHRPTRQTDRHTVAEVARGPVTLPHSSKCMIQACPAPSRSASIGARSC